VELIRYLWSYLLFIFERANWRSVVDILLVTAVVFFVLYLLKDTKALVLLRGVLFLIVVISLLSRFSFMADSIEVRSHAPIATSSAKTMTPSWKMTTRKSAGQA